MRIVHNAILISLLFLCLDTQSQVFEIGHTTVEYYDSDRDRDIQTEIYYPSDEAGDDMAIASGNFPVLIFGHGFLMGWESYQNFWTELVPNGYVICFPTTEMDLNTDHEAFGLDLKFLAAQMQIENEDNASFFFNSLADKTGLMGHSMGGGASFLGAQNNSDIQALINFAAAETSPSAITAAANIAVPSLIFSGDDDCVTPPEDNQNLMYSNLNSACKTQISIINGGHCYFAAENFTCSFGESFCNSSLDITPETQQSITFEFLTLWLDYALSDNQTALMEFNQLLEASTQINFSQSCDVLDLEGIEEDLPIRIFPNPVGNQLNGVVPIEHPNGLLTIHDIMGQKVFVQPITRNPFQIDISYFPNGTYILHYSSASVIYNCKFMKMSD